MLGIVAAPRSGFRWVARVLGVFVIGVLVAGCSDSSTPSADLQDPAEAAASTSLQSSTITALADDRLASEDYAQFDDNFLPDGWWAARGVERCAPVRNITDGVLFESLDALGEAWNAAGSWTVSADDFVSILPPEESLTRPAQTPDFEVLGAYLTDEHLLTANMSAANQVMSIVTVSSEAADTAAFHESLIVATWGSDVDSRILDGARLALNGGIQISRASLPFAGCTIGPKSFADGYQAAMVHPSLDQGRPPVVHYGETIDLAVLAFSEGWGKPADS